jgi:Phage tail protein
VFYANLIDGSTTLELRGDSWDTDPFFLRELDLGYPQGREVVTDAPGRDGTLDYTARFGSRTVTAHLYVRAGGATINTNLDALRAICAPNRRVLMRVMRDGWDEPRQLWLRATQFSSVITKTSHVYAEANLSWVAPAGILESLTTVDTNVSPIFESVGLALIPGIPQTSIALILTPGDAGSTAIALTPGTGQNIQSVINPGSLPASPVFTITGPCTNPQIILRTTNQRIRFTGLAVQPGSSVVVDVANRKVTLGSSSVYASIDWGASRWFDIPLGASTIEFDTDSSNPGCNLFVSFTPKYL